MRLDILHTESLKTSHSRKISVANKLAGKKKPRGALITDCAESSKREGGSKAKAIYIAEMAMPEPAATKNKMMSHWLICVPLLSSIALFIAIVKIENVGGGPR